MYCTKCDTPNADSAKICKACGAQLPPPAAVAYTPGKNHIVSSHPMKWFGFLIYFQLFASAAVNIIGGILNLTGATNDLGLLQTPLSVFSIVMGLYAIFIRFSLAGYQRRGPVHFKVFLLLVTVSQTLISLLTGGLPGGLITLLTNGIYMALNISYFSKRQDLFIY